MAQFETVVKLQLENQDAVRRLGAMEAELVGVRKETNALTAAIRKNNGATAAEERTLGTLRSKAKNLSAQIRELSNETSGLTASGLRFRDKMAGATTEAMSAFGLTTIGVTAAIVGLRKAVVGSLEAFAQQEQAEKQLRFSAGDAADALIAQAAALQKVTTTGDEVIISQQAFLASLGFTEDQIRQMIPAALDLAAATGQTLDFAVKNLAKTYSGLTGELGEILPELKNFTKEELQAGAATDYATKQFAGQAELLRGTYAGSMEAMRNSVGDLAEAFGGMLAPSITKAANALTKFFEGVNEGRNTRLQFEADLTRANTFMNAFAQGRKVSAIEDSENARKEIDAIQARSRAIGGYITDIDKYNAAIARLEAKKDESLRRSKAVPEAAPEHLRTAAMLQLEIQLSKEAAAQIQKKAEVQEKATVTTTEQTKATTEQAKAVRVLTDEMRAFLQAQRDIEQGVGIGRMDIRGGLTAPQTASEQGVQPGAAIVTDLEDNIGKTAQLTTDYANLFATLSASMGECLGGAFEDVADTTRRIILSILETVRSGVRLWIALATAKEVGTKGFIGLGTAAILTALVEATFAAAAASLQGFAEGGVVKGGQPIQRANGDNVLITARTGEVIMNEDQQRRLVELLGPNAFRHLGIPGFAEGGRITQARGTALVNVAGPGPSPSGVLAAQANGMARAAAQQPIYVSVREFNTVQSRVSFTQSASSL